MTRQEVYAAIDRERTSQDASWRTGRPNEAQYAFAAPHILLLEAQAAKLRDLWYGSTKEDLRDRLIKTAAITVRALEEVDLGRG